MDEIAGKIDEEAIMQIGETIYEPKNAKYFRFASKEEMDRLYEDARVIVCHAGVGSILTALEHGKPVIAVPRREKYGEHVDNHQLEIAGEMEKEGRITVVYEIKDLESVIKNVNSSSVKFRSEREDLIRELRMYIKQLEQT
jgi:UDP-N-acetylglucosamine transferase subunit ALG13